MYHVQIIFNEKEARPVEEWDIPHLPTDEGDAIWFPVEALDELEFSIKKNKISQLIITI